MSTIPEIDFVPYSTELVLPPLYGLRPYLPITPDSTMFVLLWLMTWSFLLTWLTAKVCFKEVTRADHEEVVRDEPVRETEPRNLSDGIASSTAQPAATNAAVDDAMARVVMVAAEREASAKAAVVAAMARAVEATKRERATFAAAEAAEAAAAGPFGETHNTTVVEREARMRDAALAAGAAWRVWAADRAAAKAAWDEAADADFVAEAAWEAARRAERELARG
jgi:hypothetical protein